MKKSILKGFTMIELLIVIAVLGVLAIAVLSAINPIEQINRSRDTGSRADAEQLLGAVDRFYTSMGWYPWFAASPVGSSAQLWFEIEDGEWVDNTTPTALDVLEKLSGTSGTAELKAAFVTRITGTSYNKLFVYNRGNSGDATYVCFKPASAAFRLEALNRCTAGLPPDLVDIIATVCGATPTVDTVHSCLP